MCFKTVLELFTEIECGKMQTHCLSTLGLERGQQFKLAKKIALTCSFLKVICMLTLGGLDIWTFMLFKILGSV